MEKKPSGGLLKGLKDKFRDRDSGWEDGPYGSSTDNSRTSSQVSKEEPAPVNTHQKQPSIGLFDSQDPVFRSRGADNGNTSMESTPKARKASPLRRDEEEDTLFDPSLSAAASLAHQYQEGGAIAPVNSYPNKVMTPAQFERYRQQRQGEAMYDGNGNKSDASDEENDYDDEDETERNRAAAKQRRKQEAHLAVYRQQMMKVTGEQSAMPGFDGHSSRPIAHTNSSTPNLPSMSLPTLNFDGAEEQGQKDSDSDEDIPLAVLAAHGFPNKNRPPNVLHTSNSNPSLRQSFLPSTSPSQQGAGSTAGDSRSSRLPAFARGLPADPYFGAGIVNESNRQSMAQSAYGGGSMRGDTRMSQQPASGGLVGVIATEERARAMRRGSPNAQGHYPNPNANGGGMLGFGSGQGMGPAMGMPGMMPPQGMAPDASAQLANQMQQYMEMQMQMMQQMMNMQMNQNGGQQMQMPMNMQQQMLASSGGQRPMSMMPPQGGAPSMASGHQRSNSQLAPNVSQFFADGGLPMPGYTPSIAPSERSNVGLPSRYRPVSQAGNSRPSSQAGNESSQRTSTMGSNNMLANWSNQSGGSSIRPVELEPQQQQRPNVQQRKSGLANTLITADDDEDEEAGWAELKNRKEKKKAARRTKSGNGLKDMLNFSSHRTEEE
jgi:hypothetical protein